MPKLSNIELSEKLRDIRKEIIELDKLISMLVDRRNVLDAEIMETIRKNEMMKE